MRNGDKIQKKPALMTILRKEIKDRYSLRCHKSCCEKKSKRFNNNWSHILRSQYSERAGSPIERKYDESLMDNDKTLNREAAVPSQIVPNDIDLELRHSINRLPPNRR